LATWEAEGVAEEQGVRLQKVLAEAGVASRRASEVLIQAGRVCVNGEVVRKLGVKVDPERDQVTVDGRPLPRQNRTVYVMLNKPAGVVTTARDPQGRPTVVDLVSTAGVRLFPVGRLDVDTEGLLLLTNDGELAHLLLHPRYHVPKTYLARVSGRVSPEALALLRRGVELDDGLTAPAEARLAPREAGLSVVEVILREGRKRQVKRMLAAVGHPVIALRRVAFGPLALGELPLGAWRVLEPAEVEALRGAVGESHNFPGRGPH
jgi:pseudouridine synthase